MLQIIPQTGMVLLWINADVPTEQLLQLLRIGMVLLWINADGLTPVAEVCHPFGAS
jgi:hypothetical protein